MGKKKDERKARERRLKEEAMTARDEAAAARARAREAETRLAALETHAPPPPVPAAPADPPELRRRPGRLLPGPPPGAPTMVAAREVLAGLAGAGLCYGAPVQAGERTVIPVARVRARGGMGFGGGDGPAGEGGGGGGGGGGALDAAPTGFIEVTPEGARYSSIDHPPAPPAAGSGRGRTGLAVLAGAAAALAGAALASRRRTLRLTRG